MLKLLEMVNFQYVHTYSYIPDTALRLEIQLEERHC